MWNLNQLKVGTRLAAGFGTVLVLMLIVIGFALGKIALLNDGTRVIVDEVWPKVDLARDSQALVDQTAIALRNMMLTHDEQDARQQREHLSAARKEIDAKLRKLQQLATNEQGRQKLTALLALRARYVAESDKVLEVIQQKRVDEYRPALTALRPILADYKQGLAGTVAFEIKQLASTREAAMQAYTDSRNLMLALGAAALLLGAAIGWLIRNSLVKQLGGEPAYAAQVTERIAAGDLSTAIELRSGDTSSLLFAIRTMRDSLAGIVGEVRNGTDAIATASGQIAAGNQDLSSRTEEQASSLEETAASMEELTGTVKQNADNARR